MEINPDELVTPANAAEQIECTRSHMYKLIRGGTLRHVKIDGVFFVYRADLTPDLTPRVANREKSVNSQSRS